MNSYAPANFTPTRNQLLSDEDGATAVEFAFLAPVLFVLFFGTMMLGIAYYKGLTVQWAVESVSREAMFDPEMKQEALQAVVDQSLAAIDPRLEITIALDEYMIGDIPVAHVTGAFRQTVEIPLLPPLPLDFQIDTHIPRPAPDDT